MHTVVETPEYLAAAKKAGMTEAERETAVLMLAANPGQGDMVEGSGGARKIRVPRQGRGKSGGYRVVSYFQDEDTPVFLITVISKGQQANLNDRQKRAVRAAAKGEKRKRGR
jgi:hypothetical protein